VQPDHHLALGITPAASNAEVRAAYLRVMRASHPDLRPGDRHAGELARAVNAAWEGLGDETRRGVYERLARIGPHGCRRQAEQARRAALARCPRRRPRLLTDPAGNCASLRLCHRVGG
jgi:curved DNA-binding protein CbpA